MLVTFFSTILISFSLFAADTVQSGPVASEVVSRVAKNGQADVLVYLNDGATLSHAKEIKNRTERIRFVYDSLRKAAKRTQEPLVKALEKRGLKTQSFHIVNAVAVNGVNAADLKFLGARRDVRKVRLNSVFAIQPPKLDAVESMMARIMDLNPSDIPDGHKLIGVDRVWAQGHLGAGIVVAGQDTGYDWRHPALQKQYRGQSELGVKHVYNWHDAIHEPLIVGTSAGKCGYSSAEPCDDDEHGTHTMGTMVGSDGANLIGVAPEAKWIGCRNMDQGNGRASTYLECFEYFLAPYPDGGNSHEDGQPEMSPHMINNSWGCPAAEGCTGSEFLEAVRALHAAGILVVASAGNNGPSCGTNDDAPGFYTNDLISVAAFDSRRDAIASFSSRGPSAWDGGVGPNIFAPGVNIRSSIPGGGYDYMSGTSMAGPHVAGLVALLWSAKPELIGNIQGTMNVLFKSATPKKSAQTCGSYAGDAIPNAVFGYGLVNIYDAINN